MLQEVLDWLSSLAHAVAKILANRLDPPLLRKTSGTTIINSDLLRPISKRPLMPNNVDGTVPLISESDTLPEDLKGEPRLN
jgi:hypothetical protein